MYILKLVQNSLQPKMCVVIDNNNKPQKKSKSILDF